MVTILMPAYNAGRTIEKTIKSIIKQDYINWNLVIINDGSLDNTEMICKKYSERDKRIVYYSQMNKGLMEVRKELLKYVTGDYFTFVDADDILHPQMLEIFVETAKNKGVDIVMTEDIQNMSRRFQIGLNIKKYSITEIQSRTCSSKEILPIFFMYPKYHVGLHSKLFSAKLSEINLEGLPDIFWGEDQCINALFYQNAQMVALIPQRLYNYRAGGPSHGIQPNLDVTMYRFYQWRKRFIIKNDMDTLLLRDSVIATLYTFKSLCGGNYINGIKVYSVLQEVIEDMNRLCPEIDISVFFNSLKDREKVWVEKDKESIGIKIKQMVLKWM